MTFRTHREFAISFIYLSTFYIYNNSLIDLNYYLLLIIMLCVGAKGALFPDVDHSWGNVKEKTMFNWIVNKLIHITGGKHRSWQTHSLDLTVALFLGCGLGNWYLYRNGYYGELNFVVAKAIIFAFFSGWFSHLVSDMLTVGGVYILILKKKNVRLVPKSLFGIEFKTGGDWENWFYRVNNRINIMMSIVAFGYPMIGIIERMSV